MSKERIEKYLRDYYGQKHVIWLGEGIEGDDTDGHIDDLARFIDERTIAIGIETNKRDPNYAILQKARRALDKARDQDGKPFDIVELPMPKPLVIRRPARAGDVREFLFRRTARCWCRRSASAIAIGRRFAILQKHLPKREVIGVDCRKLIWGLGAIHCFTQQQPRLLIRRSDLRPADPKLSNLQLIRNPKSEI